MFPKVTLSMQIQEQSWVGFDLRLKKKKKLTEEILDPKGLKFQLALRLQLTKIPLMHRIVH